MTGIDMFDSAYNSQFPPGAAAYAGYVDGQLGSQPNYAFIVAQFPSAQHLSVALFAEHDADALDVEGGAASPGDIPGWYARQRARGIDRPCIYASTSTMEAAVIPVIRSVPFLRSAVRLWTAHYGQGEHICGPGSCGQLSFAADGTQWTSGANGLILDQSLLLPDFFGTPVPPVPLPADWTYGPPASLSAAGGHTSVALEWEPPAGAPVPPAEYLVYVYQGPVCNRATLVTSYPRTAAASPWQGGGLVQGQSYTAHVVASGPGGARVKQYCYASASFATG